MTNSDVTKKIFGEKAHQCMWQISPNELPKDLRPMAFELYRDEDMNLVLIQLLCEDRTDTWFGNITGYIHFAQVI